MKPVPSVKQVVQRRTENVRTDAVAVRVLVTRVLEGPPGEERTAALHKLLQVVARELAPPVRAAMPEEGWALLDSSPEAEVRYLVVQMLGTADTPSAQAGLRRGLADEDRDVRWACVQALRRFQLSSEELLTHLRSERWTEREAALKLLTSPVPALLQEQLCRLLADPTPTVRYRVAELLRGSGEVPGLWAVVLESVRALDGFSQRARAIEHLREQSLRPEAIPVLCEVLRTDPSAFPRQAAALALGDFLPARPEAVEPLVDALQDANDLVSGHAAWVLCERGDLTGPLGARLLRAVEEADLSRLRRVGLVRGLSRRRHRPVLPPLLHMLCGPPLAEAAAFPSLSGYEKRILLESLDLLGELPAKVEPMLRPLAAAGDEVQRLLAGKVLMTLGVEPASLLALLSDLLPPDEQENWTLLKQTLSRAENPPIVID